MAEGTRRYLTPRSWVDNDVGILDQTIADQPESKAVIQSLEYVPSPTSSHSSRTDQQLRPYPSPEHNPDPPRRTPLRQIHARTPFCPRPGATPSITRTQPWSFETTLHILRVRLRGRVRDVWPSPGTVGLGQPTTTTHFLSSIHGVGRVWSWAGTWVSQDGAGDLGRAGQCGTDGIGREWESRTGFGTPRTRTCASNAGSEHGGEDRDWET